MRHGLLRFVAGSMLLFATVTSAFAGHRRKEEEEPKPQVLPLPRELPRALVADTHYLSFRVTPLLTIGHLSWQIHDTISALIHDTRGASIVKLRAFVSGAGDSRRVQEIVSDMFTDKKASLPVLTIVQVGALGKDTAAVVFEAVVAERKPVNPAGLAFLAGQSGASLQEAIGKVSQTLQMAQLSPADVVSATCFTSTLSDAEADRRPIVSAFPNAAVNLVQALRDPLDSHSSCEAVARLHENSAVPPHTDARIGFVTSPQVVFTGLQLSFGDYLDDADSALAHLEHDVEAVHANVRDTVLMNAFSINPTAVSALEKTMRKFNLPPNTLTVQAVEGLPSLDAALGMEAVVVPAVAKVSMNTTAPER